MERQHYLWTAGGSTVNVFLGADVITRLREAASANSAAPEIGGILFGRRKSDDSISIDDFELVSSEHRRGLTYTLSGHDKQRLGQRLRASHRGLLPVGSFRTHRRHGLYMDQYDFDLMSEHFSASSEVMLLIRPTDWHAGFFVWEEGDIARQKSYAEFLFDPAALPLVGFKPPVASLRSQNPALSSTRQLPTLMKVGLIAATAGLAAVLAFYNHGHRVPNTINAPLPVVSLASKPSNPPQVAAVNPPVYPDVDQRDNQYELHVKISDRSSPFVESGAQAQPVAHFSPPEPQPHQTPLPQPATPPELFQPIQTAGVLPLPIVSRTVLQPVHPTVVSEVSLEPAQPGVVRRGIHHVPVLNLFERHNYKSGSSFSPARPIREVKPHLPEVLQHGSNHPVDVKVWIDDTGQVTKAELLSDHIEPEIADIASNAAYKWTFRPALVSDRPVASEMVMHFRFVPKLNY